MRITKKFAGSSCIGKQVFNGGDTIIDDVKRKEIQEELKALEKCFMSKIDYQHKVAYPPQEQILAYVAAMHQNAVPHPYMGRYALENGHQVVQCHPPPVNGYPPMYYGIPPPLPLPPHQHHHQQKQKHTQQFSTTSESTSDSASEAKNHILSTADGPHPLPLPLPLPLNLPLSIPLVAVPGGVYPFVPLIANMRDIRDVIHTDRQHVHQNNVQVHQHHGHGHQHDGHQQSGHQHNNHQNSQYVNRHQGHGHHSYTAPHPAHPSSVQSQSQSSVNSKSNGSGSGSGSQANNHPHAHGHTQASAHAPSGHNLAAPYRPRQAHSSADLFGRQYPTTIEQMNFLSSENLRKKLVANKAMPSNVHSGGRMGMGDAAKFCSAAAHAYSDKIQTEDTIKRIKLENVSGSLSVRSGSGSGSASSSSSGSSNSSGARKENKEKEAKQVDLEASDLLLNFFKAAGSTTTKSQRKEGSVSCSSGSGSTSNQGEQDGDDSVSNFSDAVDGDVSASVSGRSSSLSSDRSDNNSDIDYSSHDEVESESKSVTYSPIPGQKGQKDNNVLVQKKNGYHPASVDIDDNDNDKYIAKTPRLL